MKKFCVRFVLGSTLLSIIAAWGSVFALSKPKEAEASNSAFIDTTITSINRLSANEIGKSGPGISVGQHFYRREDNPVSSAAMGYFLLGYIYDDLTYDIQSIEKIVGVFSFLSPWTSPDSVSTFRTTQIYTECRQWSFHSDWSFDANLTGKIGAEIGLDQLAKVTVGVSETHSFTHSFGYSYCTSNQESTEVTRDWNISTIDPKSSFTIGLVGTYYVIHYHHKNIRTWSMASMLWIPAHVTNDEDTVFVLANPATMRLALLLEEGQYQNRGLYKYQL